MMTAEDVQEFKNKPVVKKKRGGGQSQTPENSNAKPKIKAAPQTTTIQTNVPGAEIKSVMYETVWRVRNEILPDFPQTEHARLNSDEFAYCLMLTMVLGAGIDSHERKGMHIREASSGEPFFCKDHN
jgi:hypothetical protein